MLTLLYIDDEPELLELGRLFLEKIGDFSVTTALSGRSGLEELAQHEFDAIVSDFQMPEMDGIELLKNVRRSYGNIPFILFTGIDRDGVATEAMARGADLCIPKYGDPVTQFADISRKTREAVRQRRTEIAPRHSERHLADTPSNLPDASFVVQKGGWAL
jgi:CheY-like chemotaxis protein